MISWEWVFFGHMTSERLMTLSIHMINDGARAS